MCKLNDLGMDLGALEAVHALTDVTGFGLLGHLLEMCGTEFSAELHWKNIPQFDFLDTYLQQNIIPDNTYRNWNAWENKVDGVSELKPFQVLNDPQTSGGLLVAVSPEGRDAIVELFRQNGIASVEPIGRILERREKVVVLGL
jgi:selenide,water dikinase